jgi:hypothetical protein
VKEDGCSNFILTVVASATSSAKKATVEALHISLRALSRCYQRFHANVLISRQLHSLAQEACPRSSSQAGTVGRKIVEVVSTHLAVRQAQHQHSTSTAPAPHGPTAGNGGRRTHAACGNPKSTALRCFAAAAGRREKVRRILARVT